MSWRLAVVANEAVAGIAGLAGSFPWGEARTFAPAEETAVIAFDPDAVVVLGAEGRPENAEKPTVLWPGATKAGKGDRGPAEGLSRASQSLAIAPKGSGLWRQATWPARDDLWALRERQGEGVLVVGGTAEERERVVGKIRGRHTDASPAEELTVDSLARAAVVALLGEPGRPLPACAFAVLAAGRLLIAPRSTPSFGLLPGIDHLAFSHEDELAQYADAAATFPAAFGLVTAMGCVAARHQRASAVYGRLMTDLRLSGVLAPGRSS